LLDASWPKFAFVACDARSAQFNLGSRAAPWAI
jgi:hypothetical protein